MNRFKGKYYIRAGGQATIWQSYDLKTRRKVVFKVYKKSEMMETELN